MPDSAVQVALAIVCDAPPVEGSCAEFGLQDRAGVIDPGTRLPDGSIRFEALAEVVESTSRRRLRGAVVHGSARAQFAYLSCRATHGGWRFRLKVPLTGVADAVPATTSGAVALEARVRATGGGTVPLVDGWSLRRP